MSDPITINTILLTLGSIAAIVGGLGAILAVIKSINNGHDKMQKWDQYEKDLKSLKEEQCMLTYCMMATLDGLKQLGCNGKVTEARSELDKFMNKQAHGMNE